MLGMGPTCCNVQCPPPTHETSPAKVETEAKSLSWETGLACHSGSHIIYKAPCQVADEAALTKSLTRYANHGSYLMLRPVLPPTHEQSPEKVETEANISELGRGLGRDTGSPKLLQTMGSHTCKG